MNRSKGSTDISACATNDGGSRRFSIKSDPSDRALASVMVILVFVKVVPVTTSRDLPNASVMMNW